MGRRKKGKPNGTAWRIDPPTLNAAPFVAASCTPPPSKVARIYTRT